MTAPLIFQWSGEAMVPLPRFHNLVNAEFTVGERYRMDVIEERSERSHSHFFAALHDIWMSLPDELATQFPTDTILRKHCLIMCGYRNERKFAASSPAEARKIAAFLKPRGEEYMIVSVAGNVVVEWTAMSQSKRSMGGPTFQDSKTRVLDYAADLIGARAQDAGQAA